jgi:hypothetical protein
VVGDVLGRCTGQKYSMPTKYTKEILEDAAKHNTSIYGVLRYIGVGTNSGGMHHYISGRIKKFGIDTSHFLGVRSNCGKNHKGGPTKRTADEILVLKFSGPKEKRKKLYSALLEIGREEKCERCGLDNKWNGESLTLQIDHKNGNNLDNRRENVGFLCPNCHTQTPTHSIANTEILKTPKRKCAVCGNNINRRNKSGFCYRCASGARVAQSAEA